MLSSVQKDGSTLRDHLNAVEKVSGRRPPELDGPPLPECLEYIWGWFIQLHRRRGGGFGPAPISWEAIDAWARRTGADPTPLELELIDAIDCAYMEQAAKDSKGKS